MLQKPVAQIPCNSKYHFYDWMNMKMGSDTKTKNDVKVQDLKDEELLKNTQKWRQNTNIYRVFLEE